MLSLVVSNWREKREPIFGHFSAIFCFFEPFYALFMPFSPQIHEEISPKVGVWGATLTTWLFWLSYKIRSPKSTLDENRRRLFLPFLFLASFFLPGRLFLPGHLFWPFSTWLPLWPRRKKREPFFCQFLLDNLFRPLLPIAYLEYHGA